MTKEKKLLSLTPVGKALFDAINEEVTVVQENIIKKVGLTEAKLSEIIEIMSQIHETLIKEDK